MDETRLSRRQLLATSAAAFAGGMAGCSNLPFGSDTETPEDRSTPATPDSRPEAENTPEDDGNSFGVTLTEVSNDRESVDADGSYAEAYESVVDSVVEIRVYDDRGAAGQGAGFVYGDGTLVTNQHVVRGASEVYVRFRNSGWLLGEIVATDLYSDLAVLSVADTPENATALSLLDSDPAIGTEVVAIGNPLGLSGSVSAGIVSGVDRTLPAANNFRIPDAIQTDAAVNPGNSGGPLVTLDGDVVGVINAGGGDNIGFAISSPLTRRVVPSLIQSGDYGHPFMGVGIANVSPLLAEANDLETATGVYVDRVVDDSPSEGVFEASTDERTINGQEVPVGGDVIVAMDDQSIPTRQQLATFLALETSPRTTIDVEVIRDGSRETVELELGKRPEP
jgi:serine protease Do